MRGGVPRLVAVVAVGVLLAAAGVLAVGAFGRSADSSLIVPDTSIGDVALGMTRSQVEAAYGTPASTLQIALRGGGVGVLARYLTHGGLLLVAYADDRVVSVETTSPFFKTRNGVGAGRSKSGLHGYREEYCSGGLWDGTADMPPDQHITVFALSGEQVFSVTITEYGYYDVCAHAPPEQEGADPREGNVALSVTVSPDGAGFVRSAPYAIDCPSSCSTTFPRGTVVTLTATPTAGFTFDGWGGACSGTDGCTVTADEARSVTAHFSGAFEPPPPTTTVIKTTTGGTN